MARRSRGVGVLSKRLPKPAAIAGAVVLTASLGASSVLAMPGLLGANAFIGGGTNNTAEGQNAAVVGGDTNAAGAAYSFIGGGQTNLILPPAGYGTLGGGQGNVASGQYATIGGGGPNAGRPPGPTGATIPTPPPLTGN